MLPELRPIAWGLATPLAYAVSRRFARMHPRWYTSPLLLTWLLCFVPALALHARYRDYLAGTHWLLALLGPATMCFAVPIYEQRQLIRRHWGVLLIGTATGSALGVGTSLLLAHLLGLSTVLRLSVLPRSITTPFALDFTRIVGGRPELTATCVVLTGLLGGSLGELLMGWLPLKSAFARGAMFGMGAHTVGTVKAREVGEVEGAVAGLIMVMAGILCVLTAPVLALVLR
nr:LrgB family protein [uncultured Holophaga sp.]